MPSRIATIGRLVVRYERLMWTDLFRWLTRRPVCERGATPFGYARTVTPVMLAFIGVSVIELPILHLVIPWHGLRVAADILSVYGVIWMVGALAGLRVNPHSVGPSGLRVRGGGGLDLTIPWEEIASVTAVERTVNGRNLTVDGTALNIGVMKRTNVDIAFRYPTILELPRGDTEPVRSLRIGVDEPAAMVAAARARLAEGRTVQP